MRAIVGFEQTLAPWHLRWRSCVVFIIALPAQVVVQQGRACATEHARRQRWASPLGTQRFSHPKGPRRPLPIPRPSIRCSSPASRSRPRPTGGTAGPSGALSSHRGPSPLRKGHTRLKRGPAPAPGRVRRISVSRGDRTWVEARLHSQVISPAGVFVSLPVATFRAWRRLAPRPDADLGTRLAKS